MGDFTIFQMFENPRRGREARNFTTNVPKILDLKSSSEQIFLGKLSLGAPYLFLAARGSTNAIKPSHHTLVILFSERTVEKVEKDSTIWSLVKKFISSAKGKVTPRLNLTKIRSSQRAISILIQTYCSCSELGLFVSAKQQLSS